MMKISDLQDMLSMIRQLLVSAGGKGAADVADFSAAIEPFRDLSPKQFAAELRRLSEQPKPPPRSKKGAKRSPAEVDALIRDVRALYDRAGSPTTTETEIAESTKSLHELGKPDVLRAAEAVGLKGMKSKTIADIANEVRKRIEARKGAGQRMETIEVIVGSEELAD